MTTDYFEAKKTGGSKNSIEITIELKKDKVVDFANEIWKAAEDNTVDRVLEIIDKVTVDYEAVPTEIDVGREKAVISFGKKDGMLAMASMIRVLVLALKGEQE